jgi:glycosyltransferase involved in cell wall biosynthesis
LTGQPHILFTATFRSSFIEADIRILRKDFIVTTVITSGWTTPFLFLRELFNAHISFSWFASVYSSILVLMTRLLRKKSILILGGVDVAKERDFSYGIWLNPWKSFLVRYGLTHASIVIAVDNFLKLEAMKLARYDGVNIRTIPTGYDPEFWKPSGKKEPRVLMVAFSPNEARARLKGVDVLLRVARMLPSTQFEIVGLGPDVASSFTIPSNVECSSFIPQELLLHSYQKSKVYCQLSYREGLPNSLCEAMLCECVPVGSKVGGIPTAIGDAGYLVEYNNDIQIAEAIRLALASSPESGKNARDRIASQFNLRQREEALRKVVRELVS